MPENLFQSPDCRYGLHIPETEMRRILAHCRDARSCETGGILIGRYSNAHDWAIVSETTGPPSDSQRGWNWFRRGIRGLQQLLNRIWRRSRLFYLGEWHFHPNAPPSPSGRDIAQMKSIATTAHYRCPEPVLLIVGGDPNGEWTARAFVSRRGDETIELRHADKQPVSTTTLDGSRKP